MDTCSSMINIKQCFQCQGDTTCFCNTCKKELCVKCKERHVIDLDTKHHNVSIYREKFNNLRKHIMCAEHPDNICEMYCEPCDLPVCIHCRNHREHIKMTILTVYENKRKQQHQNIFNIRSETLYNIRALRTGIQTDVKLNVADCLKNIGRCQSEMIKKSQILRDLLDTVLDGGIYRLYICMCLKQMYIMTNKNITMIINHEENIEQSANRPVQFLKLIKKTEFPKVQDIPNMTPNSLLSLAQKINIKDLIKHLSEIEIAKRGKRHPENERLLTMMSHPTLQKSFRVNNNYGYYHISFLTSEHVWISDGLYHRIHLIKNPHGSEVDASHHVYPVLEKGLFGVHTVNTRHQLVYIDKDFNIIVLSSDMSTKETFIRITEPKWKPQSVYCSKLNGDLLVGMCIMKSNLGPFIISDSGKVARYDINGELTQTMLKDHTGHPLFNHPTYLAENNNGDVIVNDSGRGAIVVTDRGGRYRFSYTGNSSTSKISPRGVCTDVLSHILFIDQRTETIHIIDVDGQFLRHLLTNPPVEDIQLNGMNYDVNSQLLWIGTNNRVFVYRHINRSLTLICEFDLFFTILCI